MKNTTLAIFIGLLLAVSYYQEYKSSPYRNRSNPTLDSFSKELPANIDFIQAEGKSVRRKGEKWIVSGTDYEVQRDQVEAYLNLFQDVRVLEKVEAIPRESTQSFVLTLGNKLITFFTPESLTKNFYVRLSGAGEVENFLAQVENDLEGFFKDERDVKFQSFLLLKQELLSWKKTLFSAPILSHELEAYRRDFGGEKVVRFDFQAFKTTPKAPGKLGYKSALFQDFREKLKTITTTGVSRELPRGPRKWGELFFESSQRVSKFSFYSLDSIFYLKEEGKSFFLKISEASVNLLLKPIGDFWKQTFPGIIELFEQLESLVLRTPKKEVRFYLDTEKRLLSENKKLRVESLQGVKEILCYLSACHEQYKVLRIKRSEGKNYPYQITINGQRSIFFSIENSILRLFDSENKIEFQYVWSLLKKGDVFQSLENVPGTP